MKRSLPILITPIRGENLARELLEEIACAINDTLRIETRVAEPIALPAQIEDRQGQLCSNEVVDFLIARAPDPHQPACWTLALTNRDLRAPARSFVFGEATLRGAWAVVSTARLRTHDPRILVQRIVQEALHEIGHLAGIDHCETSACTMHPSTSVEEIDSKSGGFCTRCQSRFHAFPPLDPRRRGR